MPITLTGRHVILEPLAARHAAALFEAGRDETIWQFMPRGAFTSIADAEDWIAASRQSGDVAFAIMHAPTGRLIGSTRFMDIRREHRALEIGWTWLAPGYQRTGANTEAKYLLLTHAFEHLGAVRVQLKTDERNVRSQRAMERLGAIREGVHRKHMTLWNGFVRNTVFYSITNDEWPGVKQRIEKLMAAHAG